MSESNYWTRVWIIQEVYIAENILFYLGPISLDKTTIRHRLNASDTSWRAPRPFSNAKRPLTAHRGKSSNGSMLVRQASLRTVLERFDITQWECTDPRDRVYALLGLVYQDQRVNVDYGVHPSETFASLLEELIRTSSITSVSQHVTTMNGTRFTNLQLLENLAGLSQQLDVPERWQRWFEGVSKDFLDPLWPLIELLEDLTVRGFDFAKWNGIEVAKISHVLQDKRDTYISDSAWLQMVSDHPLSRALLEKKHVERFNSIETNEPDRTLQALAT